MNKIFIQYYKTKLGELIIGSINRYLCICDWRYRKMRTAVDKRIQREFNAPYEQKETEITVKAKNQIEEYISGKRREFDLPLKTAGTNFQKKVWNELIKISYGETETYSGISRRINNDNAVRAVSSAIGANALSIFIPCHRIIGKDGSLTGYAGGLAVKKRLLRIESGDN